MRCRCHCGCTARWVGRRCLCSIHCTRTVTFYRGYSCGTVHALQLGGASSSSCRSSSSREVGIIAKVHRFYPTSSSSPSSWYLHTLPPIKRRRSRLDAPLCSPTRKEREPALCGCLRGGGGLRGLSGWGGFCIWYKWVWGPRCGPSRGGCVCSRDGAWNVVWRRRRRRV